MITTVQIRLTADSEDDARAAYDELRASLGSSRVILQAPHAGRDKRGDGKPPWFVYGSWQFDRGEPPTTIAPVGEEHPRARQAYTGRTRRLKG